MTEVAATVVALAVVAAVVWRTFRGPTGRRGGRPTGSPAPAGLLAALALATAPAAGGAGAGGVASVLGLGLGSVAAVAAVAPTFRALADWAYGAVGVVATVPAMVQLVAGPQCAGGVGPAERVVMVVGLVLAASTAVLGVLHFGRIGPMPVLAWFGVVEVLAFLQAPGGVGLALSGVGRVVLVLAVCALLGLLAALRPNLVVTAATVCIALADLGLGEARLACGSAPGTAGVVATVLVLYLAAFVGLRALLRRSRR